MNFTKMLIVLVVLIGGLAGVIYYFNHILPPEYTPVVDVYITLEGNEKYANITGVRAVLKTVVMGESPPEQAVPLPGITINIARNSKMIGRWASTSYNGTGEYKISVGLEKITDAMSLKPDDEVSIPIAIVDKKARTILNGHSIVRLKSEFKP